MPPEATLARPRAGVEPQTWRMPLLNLALAVAGLLALTWGDWSEMARQWWDASTYNHILLVPPILAWLVRMRWPELAKLAPRTWWPGLAWLGVGLFAWLAGTMAGINLVSQLGAVLLLQAAVAVRAWGTIYIAQSQGIEFAAGFDHIVYGWIFFALVMATVLGASWRFFDRSPDDPLIDAAAIEASPLLARLAPLRRVP